MNRASALWVHLTPDAQDLLSSVRTCFESQPLNLRFTAVKQRQALHQVSQLESAWQEERVNLELLWSLERIAADLDLAGTVGCRAALEAVRGHLKRIVVATYEELELNE